MNNEEIVAQAILDEILNCSSCNDIGRKRAKLRGIERIEYMKKNLPALDYVKQQAEHYIFSSGITTGDAETNDKLQNWLFSKNKNKDTNHSVLKSAIGNAMIDGCCGVRVYEGNLHEVKRGYYGVLTQRIDGIETVLAYLIRNDGKKIKEKYEFSDNFETFADFTKRLKEENLIMLDSDNFFTLRNTTSNIFGESPLLRDELRLNLLVSVYEHLNYDIDFDGPGRIVLHVDKGVTDGEDISSSALINQSGGAQERRNTKALQEAERIAKQIKNSSSDAVITLSNAFSDKITHLPRVTKSTDDFFREWIRNEGVILAQVIGISPALVELGDISGNVSMEKIIDNAVENTIIPWRENYSSQFSDVISRIVGVGKVYFDKYKLAQVENINTVRAKVANMIRDISVAEKNAPSDDKRDLSKLLVEYMSNSLTNEDGKIAELNDKR